ncbi:MAG: hypothetical protein L3J89_12730 [Gammaproteobacteria bacterium]|nr:hypothetical protein [Gammaproteobacteria bacterium]
MINAKQSVPYLPNNARHTANLRFSGRVASKFVPYHYRPGANKALYFAAAAKEVMSRYNLRAITPANMAKMSSELYSLKVLTFDQHAALYFQPNIAASNPLLPTAQRDTIQEWEALIRQQKRRAQGQKQVGQSLKILTLLNRLDALTPSPQCHALTT